MGGREVGIGVLEVGLDGGLLVPGPHVAVGETGAREGGDDLVSGLEGEGERGSTDGSDKAAAGGPVGGEGGLVRGAADGVVTGGEEKGETADTGLLEPVCVCVCVCEVQGRERKRGGDGVRKGDDNVV